MTNRSHLVLPDSTSNERTSDRDSEELSHEGSNADAGLTRRSLRGFDTDRIHEGGHRASSVRGAAHGLWQTVPMNACFSHPLTSGEGQDGHLAHGRARAARRACSLSVFAHSPNESGFPRP